MSIEIITMWYNEEFLAKLFLNHYAYADKITILYDGDTNDNTLKIIKKYKNVDIILFKFPDMMDDDIKIAMINKYYSLSKYNFILSVDADEFVFIKNNELQPNILEYIEMNKKYDLFYVPLFQVYRHESDADIDTDLPAVPQRRHGDPNISEGINALYYKPILVKGGMTGFSWGHGCHTFTSNSVLAIEPKRHYKINTLKYFSTHTRLLGAHWSMADPCFAVERRIKNRRARQSRNNLDKGLTVQHHHVTVKSIMDECVQHSHDPLLF
jgi:hypothetical protein